MVQKLNLRAIRTDGGTQSRVSIDRAIVTEYAEALETGADFPPVIVFNDGADHWLADGFHRYHGHQEAGRTDIVADVRVGTARDALLHSLGVNSAHGLRRTNADKRKCVETMLRDSEWRDWSDVAIAKACGVSDKMVASCRRAIFGISDDAVRTVTRGGVTFLQNVKRKPQGTPKKVPAKKLMDAQTELSKQQAAAESVSDQLNEAFDTISDLAEDNAKLQDRLAVESLMEPEAAKTEVTETIRDLRARVGALEAENAALKVSRDTYMREASEARKDAIYWRKKAERATA